MSDYGTVARPYAKALFDIAHDSGQLEAWSHALNTAAEVVGDSEAKQVLTNPRLDAADRADFIGDICSRVDAAGVLATAEGRNLLRLLAENDRLAVLGEIAAQYDQLKAQAENKIKVTLVSASTVEDELADRVAKALEHKLGRKVELALEVDASLLGGAILRAEDQVIDGSVRSRLQRLAESLAD
jgi:F-type H+-transporting ATPase subunit delta